MSVLKQLKHAFDGYADTYRAHVERALAPAVPGANEAGGIAQDLESLGVSAEVFR
jgi:hypothetical protein